MDPENTKGNPGNSGHDNKKAALHVGETSDNNHGFCYMCGASIDYAVIKVPAPGQQDKKTATGEIVRDVWYEYVFMHNICAFRYLWHIVGAKIVKSTTETKISTLVTREWKPWKWLTSLGKVNEIPDLEVQDLKSIDLIIEKDEAIPDNSVWDYKNQIFVKRKDQ